MEGSFDREALDRLLLDKFRGDMPNMEAAWKILRRWPLGNELFQLLLDGSTLEEVDEHHATCALHGLKVTVYPDRGHEGRTGS